MLVSSLAAPLLPRAGQEIPVLGRQLEAEPGGEHQELRSNLGQPAQSSQPQLLGPRGRGQQLWQLGELGELREQLRELGDTQGQHSRLWRGESEAGVNIARDYGG